MKSKHTPTPIDTDTLMTVLLGNGYRRNRAEMIVRAVNAHEELLKHLKHLAGACRNYAPHIDTSEAYKAIAKAES